MGKNKNKKKNVTTGAPAYGGYIHRAPAGTVIPTNATAELSEDFKCLGYVSEDGLTYTGAVSSNDVKDWSGATVATTEASRDDKWKVKLIEALNEDVMKVVHGSGNVTGTVEAGLTIKANNAELESGVYVIDMLLRDNVKKRVVLPDAKVSDIGDVTYNKKDVVAYDITLTCAEDDEGNTHYEYMKKLTGGEN